MPNLTCWNTGELHTAVVLVCSPVHGACVWSFALGKSCQSSQIQSWLTRSALLFFLQPGVLHVLKSIVDLWGDKKLYPFICVSVIFFCLLHCGVCGVFCEDFGSSKVLWFFNQALHFALTTEHWKLVCRASFSSIKIQSSCRQLWVAGTWACRFRVWGLQCWLFYAEWHCPTQRAWRSLAPMFFTPLAGCGAFWC